MGGEGGREGGWVNGRSQELGEREGGGGREMWDVRLSYDGLLKVRGLTSA